MILAFKKFLVKPILAGTKLHTLREDKNNRWRVGMPIQMATGVRTSAYEQFNKGRAELEKCKGIETVKISFFDKTKYAVEVRNGKKLAFFVDGDTNLTPPPRHLSWLSKNDGFENANDFLNFFRENYPGGFTGKIIHWTDFNYYSYAPPTTP